jgi:hypothetical protein
MPHKNTEERQAMNVPWMLNGTDALWSALRDYQREVLDFMSMRLSKDSDFVRDLQGCRSWEEVALRQSKWMQETLTDYSRETAKVLNIAAKQTGNAQGRSLRLVA